MVMRKRFRSVMLALGFYAFAGGAVSYFAYHAHHGARGLHAKTNYKIKIASLQAELLDVKQERAEWERRVKLMGVDNLDRDILDERARALLNQAHKNDVIVILPKAQ
jgi:cell division protein FtsB